MNNPLGAMWQFFKNEIKIKLLNSPPVPSGSDLTKAQDIYYNNYCLTILSVIKLNLGSFDRSYAMASIKHVR